MDELITKEMEDNKKHTREALLEISNGHDKAIDILVDSIYDGNIEIVDATKCAKGVCRSYLEIMAITIIGDAFRRLEKQNERFN